MTSTYIRYPASGSGSGVATYATAADLPASAPDGSLALTLDSYTLYTFEIGGMAWVAIATPGGAGLVIGSIDSQTPSDNGAVASGSTLYLQSASATKPGLANITTQTFAGVKTFSSAIKLSSLTATTVPYLDASKQFASSAVTPTELGYVHGVTSAIQTQLDAKAPSFTAGDLTEAGSAIFTITGGTGAVIGSGASIQVNLTDSHIFVGNASNVAASVSLSGDATINNTGALTIGVNKISNAKLAQMATLTIKGNNTGSTANALDLTVSQVNTLLGTVSSIGTIDSQSKSADGAVIASSALVLQSADATHPGLVTSSSQTIAGAKTFSTAPILSSLTASLPLQLDGSKNVTAAAINLSGSQVTSTLAIGNGGTGQVSAGAAFNALSPMTTLGDVIYGGASGAGTRLAGNTTTTKKFLTQTGDGVNSVAPGWNTIVAGDLPAISLTSGVSGVLPIANGGTNLSAAGSDGQLVKSMASTFINSSYTAPWINYIGNAFAEVNTTGWATYADSASNIPTDGTGGTATGLTFSRSTSSPIRGASQFSLVQSNSTNIQGKGVSYDFTIDPADKGNVLSVQFDYNASSTFVASNGVTAPLNDGTTSTNAGNSDIEVFIYDITNAVLVYVSPQVITANGANNFTFKGVFQTASNSASYRVILHVATSNANATGWTLLWSNMYVGPQKFLQGSPITDPVAYTPTFTGFGTATGINFVSWRVGAYLFIEGTFTAGTNTGTEARITLGYNGTSANVTSVSTLPTLQEVGKMNGTTASATNFGSASVLIEASKTYLTLGIESSTANGLSKSNGNAFTNSNTYSLFAMVPITGWSSTVQMSNDSDTRIVALNVIKNGGAVTANTAISTWTTVNQDTHGAFSSGTYTVPVAGDYVVSFHAATTSGTPLAQIRKNASLVVTGTGSGVRTVVTDLLVGLIPGDAITVSLDSSLTCTSTATDTLLSISRVSGPSVLAALDSIAAKYNTSTQTVGTSEAVLNCTQKEFDTTSSYSSGTFTVPVSGKYRVSALIFGGNTTASSINNAVYIYARKNGSDYSLLNYFLFQVTGSLGPQVSGTTLVPCVAGDTIDVAVKRDSAVSSFALVSGSANNWVSFERVGN